MRTGTDHEVWFWRGWLGKHGRAYETPRPLRADVDQLILGPAARILNIGCGAANLIGELSDRADVTVLACDMLADDYKAIHAELGLVMATPIIREDMTRLSFPDASFDVVVCKNALDHCVDAEAAMSELVRVCRPGGAVYLDHFKQEGRRLRYSGLHQWNVDMRPDGECEVWNKNRERVVTLSTYGSWHHVHPNKRIYSVMRKPS